MALTRLKPLKSPFGAASLAAELYTACQGVDLIRTHDVAAISDVLARLRCRGRTRARSLMDKRDAIVAVLRRGDRVLIIRRGAQAR
jgi:hypothetical protein